MTKVLMVLSDTDICAQKRPCYDGAFFVHKNKAVPLKEQPS